MSVMKRRARSRSREMAPAPRAPQRQQRAFDRRSLAGNRATSRLSTMPYPHNDRIRQAFGVGLSFRSVHDPAGCAARGTPAFTDGTVTHFDSRSPSLHVAAHEAAHQVQHAGITTDAGLGPERHAAFVANAVRGGRSARSLLGTRGAHVPVGVRHYSDVPEGRLADTGETLTPGGHTAWATSALIAQAAGVLKTRRSGVSLVEGSGTLDKYGQALKELKVQFEIDPSGEEFYSDCRQAANEVMGGKGKDVTEKAIVKAGGAATEVDVPEWTYADVVGLVIYTDERIRQHAGYDKLPEEEKKDFIAKVRWDFKWRLSLEERRAYRKKAVDAGRAKEMGINEHAMPKVGEAFAVFPASPGGKYVFHFATVIMAPGSDRVTLENAGGEKGEKSRAWSMQTYGSKAGQTFHEQQVGFGDDRKTLVIGNQPAPPPDLGDVRSMGTRELIERSKVATDAAELYYLQQELDSRSLQVFVNVLKTEDWKTDDVFVQIGGHETSTVGLSRGQAHWFFVSLGQLLPFSDPIVINVYDWDVDFNDLIGSISWSAPYSVAFQSLTGDEAHYNVTVMLEERGGAGGR